MMVRSKYVLFSICMFCVMFAASVAAIALEDDVLLDLEYDNELTYYIRLVNGDVVTGPLTEVSSDGEGAYLRVSSAFGRAKIYAKEISWISTADGAYRYKHRGFLLPTAQPIRGDHFIALIEGIMPYIGIGIGDWGSISAGRSLLPGINWREQISVINAKVTVFENEYGLVEQGRQYYAVGFNGGWVNDYNFIGHVFGVATFTGKRTQVSTMLFAKVAGKEIYTITANNLFSPIGFAFANGTIGVALGMDTRFPEMHDLHFVAELWNADLRRPSNTVLYAGLRLATTSVGMDFGFTLAPGPALVPTIAFAWTPF